MEAKSSTYGLAMTHIFDLSQRLLDKDNNA